MPNRRIAFVVKSLGMMDIIAVPAIAALAIERGWAAQVVVWGPNPKKAIRELRAFGPDIIAYSVCSNESRDYVVINQKLKKEFPFFSLFGGYHGTFYPGYVAEDGVDAVCRGEAYVVFPQFLEQFGSDAMYEVENFSFKLPDGQLRHNPLCDLRRDFLEIPYPARELVYQKSLYLRNNPAKPFMASRGCPYSCSYCYNSAFKQIYEGRGRILCNKDVDYLLGEINSVREKFPLHFVRFSDDTFGANIAWLREFTEKFRREIALPYACYVRANLVSEEFAQLLHDGGCYSVNMAIESGNDQLRREILQRSLSNEQIKAAFERLHRHGIRVMSLNMLGLPNESEEQLWETVRLNQEVHPDHAHVCIFQPYPGTEAHRMCCEKGLLDPDDQHFDNLYSGWSHLNFTPEYKQRLFVMHKLFPLLVDHPRAEPVVRMLLKTRRLNRLLDMFTRFYFGFFAYRNVYAGARIPLWVRAIGAVSVLFSRNRV